MTGLRGRWLPLTVLAASITALAVSFVWVAQLNFATWPSGSMMGPTGGMGSVIRGEGPVDGLAGAEEVAERFGDRWGLSVAEVMEFDNGFYVELVDPSGQPATEVLVDPGSGSVQVEWGPAMMWNTAYGMHANRAESATVDGDRARALADAWLDEHRSGERAGPPEAFPGYYTMHTLRDGEIVGMLSVHATSGRVWHHAWHGEFIAISEHS